MSGKYALLRAVRGPLVLITLGVLFLMDQLATIPFYRTWPILFIVFGVLKLFERLAAPPVVVPPPPYGSASGFGNWPPPPPPGQWQPPAQGGVQK